MLNLLIQINNSAENPAFIPKEDSQIRRKAMRRFIFAARAFDEVFPFEALALNLEFSFTVAYRASVNLYHLESSNL